MALNNRQNPLLTITLIVRLPIYICIFLLMVNINPIVDAVTHPDIPYFDEEHLIVGFVTGTVCIIIFIILEIYLRYLAEALHKIRVLESYLSICANCKKIRIPGSDPHKKESWVQLEAYITEKTHTQFSHGICPDCITKLYPELAASILHDHTQSSCPLGL